MVSSREVDHRAEQDPPRGWLSRGAFHHLRYPLGNNRGVPFEQSLDWGKSAQEESDLEQGTWEAPPPPPPLISLPANEKAEVEVLCSGECVESPVHIGCFPSPSQRYYLPGQSEHSHALWRSAPPPPRFSLGVPHNSADEVTVIKNSSIMKQGGTCRAHE